MSRSTRRFAAASTGLALLVTGLVTGLVPGAGAPAQASRTVSESYPVPSDGVLRLTGHGFGHGHGMSQYGAQGAAKRGLTHQQILAFYYPGTVRGTVTGTIRVLISADTDHEVRVDAASGLRVREVDSGTSWALPASAAIDGWRLRVVGGATTLEYDNAGWHAWRPGGHALSGDAELYRAGAVGLRVAGSTRLYRGAVRLSAGNTVNVVDVDDYVRGVVPREMPASWEPAAVRSQAVAARTYGAWDRAAHPTRSWQTCDTTSCQVYGGVASEDSRTNAAVDATAGQVLLYAGKPAFTQFGSSSGGWLSDGGMPYLVAKADPYDGFAGNTMHTWTTTLTRAAIQREWPSLGTLRRVVVTQRDGHGEWLGRVESMVLDGSRADVTISGTTFRSRFGLRSQWFRLGNVTSTPAPTPTPTPTPAPAQPAPAVTPTPITQRWRAIGGTGSVLGRAVSREYAVAGGRARRFQHGRMFAKRGDGVHELYGPVLAPYVSRGGATSRLGFPRTAPVDHAQGTYARFEHGTLFVYDSGRVRVTYG